MGEALVGVAVILLFGSCVGMLLYLSGPPRQWFCDNSLRRHDFGQWEKYTQTYQKRVCKRCGWTEVV